MAVSMLLQYLMLWYIISIGAAIYIASYHIVSYFYYLISSRYLFLAASLFTPSVRRVLLLPVCV